MRTSIVGAAVAVAGGLVLSAPRAVAGDAEGLVELSKAAGYPAVEAVRKAGAAAGGGAPFHVELERDEGRVVWSVDFAQEKKTLNVVLDAKTGAVLEKELDESEDHSATVSAAKVTLLAALEKATATRGFAVDAHLRLVEGKPVIGLKVVDGASVRTGTVDGVTGMLVVFGDSVVLPADDGHAPDFTSEFHVEPGELVSSGTNPFFALVPGTVLELSGKEDGEAVRLTVTVTNDTKTVAGVETRVVEEREEHGGVLAEVSRNYFAISKRTNSIYYFGEDVDLYEGGKVVRHEGSWVAGEKGARFGLMVPGTPLLGARYYQEMAPGVAMDRAEIVAVDSTVDTPAGPQAHCVETDEWGLGESKPERKAYARGVGLVRDGSLRLVKVTRPK